MRGAAVGAGLAAVTLAASVLALQRHLGGA